MTFTVETGSDLLVRMEHVSKQYLAGDLTVEVLRDINLQIPRGEFVVALGVSGSGKTTLLNRLRRDSLRAEPTAGRVYPSEAKGSGRSPVTGRGEGPKQSARSDL